MLVLHLDLRIRSRLLLRLPAVTLGRRLLIPLLLLKARRNGWERRRVFAYDRCCEGCSWICARRNRERRVFAAGVAFFANDIRAGVIGAKELFSRNRTRRFVFGLTERWDRARG